MVFTTANYVYVVFFGIVMCAPAINKDGKGTNIEGIVSRSPSFRDRASQRSNNNVINSTQVYCSELPIGVLEEVLGAAYNPRYMSINEPVKPSEHNGKRTTTDEQLEFYVDQDFSETIEDQPAWTIKNHVGMMMGDFSNKRYKRSLDYKQEWQCKSLIKWIDLGLDYFPRYLRSVECLSKKCWFDLYECKPRSFTVKILKRRRNRCVTASPHTRVGVAGLPSSLKELWVWEERAVNFCCDCAM